MAVGPFRPHGCGTLSTNSISATTSSGRVALSAGNYNQWEIYNSGSDNVYVEFGDGTVTATVPNGATPGGYPIGPGQCKIISLNFKGGAIPTNMAAIAASGTQTVFVTGGEGE